MAELRGTIGNDLLNGTAAADDISGLAGNDRLFGYGGNDELEGDDGNDRLDGGAGHDELEGGNGNDTLIGGAGNDELDGGDGNDLFVFNAGRDAVEDFNVGEDKIKLDASLGIDSFSELMSKASTVDDGDDVLFNFGNGNTLLLDDTRLDALKADHFGFEPMENAAVAPAAAPAAAAIATEGDDRYVGTAGNDRFDGRGGDDDIYGQAGNDVLRGGTGNDDIDGGTGNDTLLGGDGNDDLEGSHGNDRLDGGSGRNELEGGGGIDTFVFKTGITEIEDYKPGTDRVVISESLGVSSFGELMGLARSVDDGEDVRINFGNNTVLTFEDTTLAQMKSSDFFFT